MTTYICGACQKSYDGRNPKCPHERSNMATDHDVEARVEHCGCVPEVRGDYEIPSGVWPVTDRSKCRIDELQRQLVILEAARKWQYDRANAAEAENDLHRLHLDACRVKDQQYRDRIAALTDQLAAAENALPSKSDTEWLDLLGEINERHNGEKFELQTQLDSLREENKWLVEQREPLE